MPHVGSVFSRIMIIKSSQATDFLILAVHSTPKIGYSDQAKVSLNHQYCVQTAQTSSWANLMMLHTRLNLDIAQGNQTGKSTGNLINMLMTSSWSIKGRRLCR